MLIVPKLDWIKISDSDQFGCRKHERALCTDIGTQVLWRSQAKWRKSKILHFLVIFIDINVGKNAIWIIRLGEIAIFNFFRIRIAQKFFRHFASKFSVFLFSPFCLQPYTRPRLFDSIYLEHNNFLHPQSSCTGGCAWKLIVHSEFFSKF